MHERKPVQFQCVSTIGTGRYVESMFCCAIFIGLMSVNSHISSLVITTTGKGSAHSEFVTDTLDFSRLIYNN